MYKQRSLYLEKYLWVPCALLLLCPCDVTHNFNDLTTETIDKILMRIRSDADFFMCTFLGRKRFACISLELKIATADSCLNTTICIVAVKHLWSLLEQKIISVNYPMCVFQSK